ncbi:hypothetical protein [Ferrimonas marina]|uniref:Uncharacterized protein n=1 Tax=Ferrimonas marina TaxID=299255 RepID=A0A1M5VTZ9_9GAMM|nr:hypothetical protein [Ferrimonas marina]SHH78454.1 hypothetical protein SAMN02745129_2974 [Ferrimonas marina]
MNTFYVLAGLVGLVGAGAHISMGYSRLKQRLSADSGSNDDDAMRLLLTFFWHTGSLMLLSLSLLLLLEGLGAIPIHPHLQWFICAIWILMTLQYVVLILPLEKSTRVLLPAVAGVLSSVLILLGLN